MAFSSSLPTVTNAIESLSPEARRDREWKAKARQMEVQKFASQMKANKLANERAEVENKVVGEYEKLSRMERAFKSIQGIDPLVDPEKYAAALEGLDEKEAAAIKSMQGNPEGYNALVQRRLAVGDLGTEMNILKADAQSNIGELASDLRRGFIGPDTFDAGIKGLNQGTSEFERLLATSGLSEAERTAMREQRLRSIVAGKKGFAIEVDENGAVTITEGADGNTHTQRLDAKAAEKFKQSVIDADKFMHLSNKFIEDAMRVPEAGGVAGAVALMGNEMVSGVKNMAKLIGVGDADGNFTESGRDEIFDNNGLWGDAAGLNKTQKGRILDLAIAYAGIKGQTGRALSDTDLKLALDQIGVSTNNPRTIARSLTDLQERMAAELQITAKARGYEYSGLSQYDPQYKHYNTDDLPDGASFVGVADGYKYYIDSDGQKKRKPVE